MQKIRWGFLATGGIAHQVAEDIRRLPDAEIAAVGSRSAASAEAFGARWDIPRRYPSYEALAADPDVDVIYIATPHAFHYENMLLCLNAGKHVLCEKAFTINARQAEECIGLARQKGLFLMEAMWMRFLPAFRQAQEWIAAGKLGEVSLIEANFTIPIPGGSDHRLYDPALGGGALLDLGVYPITFAATLLGMPDQVASHARLGATGVDEFEAIQFRYASGAAAQLSASQVMVKPCEAHVIGERGYLKLYHMFHCSRRITFGTRHETQDVELPFEGNGYGYEVEEVHRCLRAGRTESAVVPLDETLAIMRLMDGLRAEWGVVYPGE
jgi:predicted dehydrogenase